MSTPLLVFLIVLLAAVLGAGGLSIPLLFWRRQRRDEQRFTALATELGTEREGDRVPIPGFAGRCTAHLQPEGRNTPALLEVTCSDHRDGAGSSPTILLRREGSLDRLGKALGLNREVQIGDAAFDRAVYVESDAPDAVLHWLLGDATRRRAVRDVLDLGFAELTIHGRGSLLSAKRSRPRAVHLGAPAVRDVARCLSLLAPGIPAHDPRADASLPTSAFRSALPGVLVLVGVAGVLAAQTGMFALRDAYHPVTNDLYVAALWMTGGLVALALPVLGLTLRGHSDSFRNFVFSAVLLVAVLAPGTVGAFLLINATLDTSAGARRPGRVVEHRSSSGKNGGFHLVLAGLRPGDDNFRMEVDGDTYARVAASTEIVVTTGRGALGFEWIRRLDAAPKP